MSSNIQGHNCEGCGRPTNMPTADLQRYQAHFHIMNPNGALQEIEATKLTFAEKYSIIQSVAGRLGLFTTLSSEVSPVKANCGDCTHEVPLASSPTQGSPEVFQELMRKVRGLECEVNLLKMKLGSF